MDWNFWKGVFVGIGGLLLLSMFMSFWSWLPWLALGAGGVYAYHRLTRKSPDSLADPSDRARQIAEEVDRRIDQLRR